MSRDEQDQNLGKLLREQREAEKRAACYREQAEQAAQDLARAARVLLRQTKSTVELRAFEMGDHDVKTEDIAFVEPEEVRRLIRGYKQASGTARNRAKSLEDASP